MPQVQSWFPVQKQPTLAVTFTPLPQLSHAHLPLPPSHLVTKTDAMFQHQLLPTQLQPFPPSHTPLLLLLTVTTMAVTPRLSLLNVLKKLQQPPFLQNHTLLLPLLTVTTTAVTPRLSLPRLPNKHHWPLAQSPSLLLQLLILLLPAPSLVLSFNPKVWLLV
ncbi:AQG_2a_G0016780.mRNA.1.CDS.1 [Saccharomyces cerevisiae]|uniref:Uncharacterized protein YAR068W n=5 Tax=Saccharomyces cerevisiae TaxID=4932 RepID=YAN8_YEAST|nr:uncharacterized protein YAR068W [Saccharomyces cerevisiae S288C]P39564.1 RecName: Full=Uncharacterized protein YAR068W [Saccharomyces cerevisiae S288C]AAC09505.1 Yar068wp [Saccharomyces cerevisiae]AHY74380.1 hypothetical protein H779_YJM993A00087 [Saccharomyces cerevisiae YJM993]AJO92328.1 hypothetical protein H747_YJM189A00082 [Saccharomyces cerevisiae YJM189]AJO92548.1 hypothetical protein H750_YJM244A00086 [Saccharomyces cerevisiae YJM244]AJO92696.1 hypothetical protein H752_YJM270A0008|eukprot:NP_009431.1 hypothetical protein YAR068W [Saccharomyces cerevisiae S288C]